MDRLVPGSTEFDAAVEALGPWWFEFEVEGKTFGGTRPRETTKPAVFLQWVERLGDPLETILELGSHEGSHSLQLANYPGVRSVVGLEGHSENVARAEFVKRIFASDTITFHHTNLEEFDSGAWPVFDAVFCAGLLYHLPRPWELLHNISPVCRRYLFLDTHYAGAGEVHVDQYSGSWFTEGTTPVSGLSSRSFWLTFKDLVFILMSEGFVIRYCRDLDNKWGPRIWIIAQKVGPALAGADPWK